jgi:hypothetical protein
MKKKKKKKKKKEKKESFCILLYFLLLCSVLQGKCSSNSELANGLELGSDFAQADYRFVWGAWSQNSSH